MLPSLARNAAQFYSGILMLPLARNDVAPILGQLAGGYSIPQLVLIAIVVVGVISILVVFLRARGIQIPAEFQTYAWIVLAVIVAAFAVKILLSML